MSATPLREKKKQFRSSSIATLLLVGVGGVAVGSSFPIWHRLYGESWIVEMIRSGSRAGVVGGLADWFAVTALFRHPMGIPIPHTAILPRRKTQLGQAMGRFVADHFFTDHDLKALLTRFDCAQAIAKTLQNPATKKAVVDHMCKILPGVLDRLEDGRGAMMLTRLLPVVLRGHGVAPLVVRVLRAMVSVDVHQEVFSFFLGQLKDLVTRHEPELHRFVEERVREQGGRLVGWAVGGRVATQSLHALKAELDRIDPMDSELRHGFTTWVHEKIAQIEEEPTKLTQLVEHIADFLAHDALKEWWGSLWQRLRVMTDEDSQKIDGWNVHASNALLDQVLEMLKSNVEFAQKLNVVVTTSAVHTMSGIREEVAALIARVIAKWDGPGLAERLERGVGKDLAYIRMNGTVVGFLVGAVLDIILRLISGL